MLISYKPPTLEATVIPLSLQSRITQLESLTLKEMPHLVAFDTLIMLYAKLGMYNTLYNVHLRVC